MRAGRSATAMVTGAEPGRASTADSPMSSAVGAPQRGLQHRHGLGRELLERAVAVHAGAQVDLGDRLGPEALGEVDEQAEVDAVALDEGHLLERLTPAGVLAGEGLHDGGEVREQQRQHRPGDEFGDPPPPWPSRRWAGRRSP